MEEKYYTPTIEEFHVGFEYEYKETFLDGTVKTQEEFDSKAWKTAITDCGDLPYIARSLSGTNSLNGLIGLRVKHLNQEGLEDLGFTVFSTSPLEGWMLKHNKQINIKCIEDHKIALQAIRSNRLVFDITSLLIKNKSELKRILRQLQIIE